MAPICHPCEREDPVPFSLQLEGKAKTPGSVPDILDRGSSVFSFFLRGVASARRGFSLVKAKDSGFPIDPRLGMSRTGVGDKRRE